MNTWLTSSGGKVTAESRSRAEELARQYDMGTVTKRLGKCTNTKAKTRHVEKLLECLEPKWRFDWLYKNADDWVY